MGARASLEGNLMCAIASIGSFAVVAFATALDDAEMCTRGSIAIGVSTLGETADRNLPAIARQRQLAVRGSPGLRLSKTVRRQAAAQR